MLNKFKSAKLLRKGNGREINFDLIREKANERNTQDEWGLSKKTEGR